ncbi:MAG: Arm DNA-binding domain-containing protein [Pseudolabrys sp.]
MPRTLHKLNAAFVKKVVNLPTAERAALRPRRHSDGGNLYLSTKRGGAAFVFKYTQSGTRNSKEVPIGSAFSMTLTQAREKADALRKADGDVASAHQKAREAVLNQTTFGAYAVKVAPDLTRTLRHEKSRRAWLAALEKHAAPLWSMLLDAIEPHHVAECIRPIWIESRTTGDMVRRAIKDVLASAKARGLAHFASNPADMETMQAILGRRHDKKVNGREYQPYKKTPTTYKKLAARDRVTA